MQILLSMVRNKIIKIVPYTGFGRNTDYTLELQLSLNDVVGLGSEDKKKAEAGAETPSPDAAAPPPPVGGGPPAAAAEDAAAHPDPCRRLRDVGMGGKQQ